MIQKRNILALSLISGLLLALYSCGYSQSALPEALAYQIEGRWGLIQSNGEPLVSAGGLPSAPSAVVNGRFTITDHNGYCYLYDAKSPHAPLIPERYFKIGYFRENTTIVQKEPWSPIQLMDKSGKIIATMEEYMGEAIMLLHNFCDGLALFGTQNGKFGFINTKGEIVVPPIYDFACDFNEEKALVAKANRNGQLGFMVINRKGEQISALQQLQSSFDTQYSDGLLKCRSNSSKQYTFLNKKGNVLLYLPQGILDVTRFQYGAAVCLTEGGYGVINPQGDFLIPDKYEQIEIIDKKQIALCKNGKWGICDFSHQLISDFNEVKPPLYYEWKNVIQTADSVIQDPYAKGIMVESFVRKQTPQETTMKTVQEEVHNTTMQETEKRIEKKDRVENKEKIPTVNWKNIAHNNPFYQEAAKVISGKLEEKDAQHRRIILDYVEQLRISYTNKDIDFLEQVFSEKALIIVGQVVHTLPNEQEAYLPTPSVRYSIKSKKEYLNKLKAVFQANRKIDLRFSNFRIMRHPSVPGIYGVSLQQGYRSDLYSDDGYLFLLWDFRQPDRPKIHVRTWQPSMLDAETPLPQKDIIDISAFNF